MVMATQAPEDFRLPLLCGGRHSNGQGTAPPAREAAAAVEQNMTKNGTTLTSHIKDQGSMSSTLKENPMKTETIICRITDHGQGPGSRIKDQPRRRKPKEKWNNARLPHQSCFCAKLESPFKKTKSWLHGSLTDRQGEMTISDTRNTLGNFDIKM